MCAGNALNVPSEMSVILGSCIQCLKTRTPPKGPNGLILSIHVEITSR